MTSHLRRIRTLLGLVIAIFVTHTILVAQSPSHPNIVIIYADDLGYGDVGAYGATEIKTPNFDRIAKEGLRFTSGYSTSATCTPSRYGLLTGEYPWRKKGTGIAPGDANLIIEPGRTTLASVLKSAGYRTGVVGKWHLGLGEGKIDWNKKILPNPSSIGFDHSMIMAATGDRVPCVYVRDGLVVGLDPNDPIEVQYGKPIDDLPSGKTHPEMLRMKPSHGHDNAIVDGISRIGFMKGGKSALWKDEEMADTFTRAALSFIESGKQQPFFLLFALHDPHVPRVPHPRFVGSTTMGPRGDAIAQADWCAGEILKRLDTLGIAENTMVILSSDNGPVVDDGYQDQAVEKLGIHRPAGPLRGGKYSKFEGGTRVPFVIRWPARIKPGVSDAIISQIDLLASLSKLTGAEYDRRTAKDTMDLLPALLGESAVGRDSLVEHAGGLALRSGKWKYIEGSAGPAKNANTNSELGNLKDPQLYDLEKDRSEQSNLAQSEPQVVQKLQQQLDSIRQQ